MRAKLNKPAVIIGVLLAGAVSWEAVRDVRRRKRPPAEPVQIQPTMPYPFAVTGIAPLTDKELNERLRPGMSPAELISEFGEPISRDGEDGTETLVYLFKADSSDGIIGFRARFRDQKLFWSGRIYMK